MNNKALRIGIDIALVLIGIVFLIFGIKDAIKKVNDSKISDNVLFSKNYSEITTDNIYDYVDLKQANKLLNEGTGVLLIGSKRDSWSHVLIKPLNDIVREHLEQIYYLELDDINSNDDNYKKIEEKVSSIDVPHIILVKNGVIEGDFSHNDLIDADYNDAPIEYYNEERIITLKEKLEKISELK